MTTEVLTGLTKMLGQQLLGVSHDQTQGQCLLVFESGALLFKSDGIAETKIVGHDVVQAAVKNRLDVISQAMQERKMLTELLEKIKR